MLERDREKEERERERERENALRYHQCSDGELDAEIRYRSHRTMNRYRQKMPHR